MPQSNIFHALGLHMHQPPGNLRLLAESNEWEAQQIIRCYDRVVRYAHKYPHFGFLHVGFSGVLLEQLRDPWVIDRYRQWIDIPAMLDAYRTAENIELIGMGYFHPVFPLIPVEDWADQLVAGQQIMEDTFGRAPVGFWPPEMAFCPEMIPALAGAGFEYAVVDGAHVQPFDGVHDIYRPYTACWDGQSITVVPREHEVSGAQATGLTCQGFAHDVRWRANHSPRPLEPRLLTTWSDGENSAWFREMDEATGFFGAFFAPYVEFVGNGEFPIRPVPLAGYLRDHPPECEAHVRSADWIVGSVSGFDFSHWGGSEAQRHVVNTVRLASGRYWAIRTSSKPLPAAIRGVLDQARRLILQAQTSCYLYWGEAWLPRLYELTGAAETLLTEAEAALATQPEPAARPAATPAAPTPAAPTPAAPTPATRIELPVRPAAEPAAEPSPEPSVGPTPILPWAVRPAAIAKSEGSAAAAARPVAVDSFPMAAPPPSEEGDVAEPPPPEPFKGLEADHMDRLIVEPEPDSVVPAGGEQEPEPDGSTPMPEPEPRPDTVSGPAVPEPKAAPVPEPKAAPVPEPKAAAALRDTVPPLDIKPKDIQPAAAGAAVAAAAVKAGPEAEAVAAAEPAGAVSGPAGPVKAPLADPAPKPAASASPVPPVKAPAAAKPAIPAAGGKPAGRRP